MILKTSISMTALALVLAGCGHSQGERAVSGGAIGAGVGAVGSTILAADPITGAVVGGAVGAAAGAMTDEDDVDLGKPAWK